MTHVYYRDDPGHVRLSHVQVDKAWHIIRHAFLEIHSLTIEKRVGPERPRLAIRTTDAVIIGIGLTSRRNGRQRQRCFVLYLFQGKARLNISYPRYLCQPVQ